ncbi:hypothetical protein NQ176_g983 [Zarea fungicola]|uniref:Uncharacterized protein n=1 Tax=Zarea fungicola TaxID=93591 RepID=A0ACC1NUM8_9HYPO|nr:hypothetical protein NQ176_g983 [Lecanicillium fungicola]
MPPRRIPDEEWDLYKELILELFPKLERAQLLQHLSHEYGFCPTPNQYEYQKKKWGLMKNKTQEEWKYIDRSVRIRQLNSKDSKIVAHNSVVTLKQLRRARKWPPHCFLSVNDFDEGTSAAPAGVVISTPPAEADPWTGNVVASTSPSDQFEIVLKSYVCQYRSMVSAGARVDRSPLLRAEFDCLLTALTNFGFDLPLQMGGFSLASDEESLLYQRQERLRLEIDNLVKDCSEENVRQCDHGSTATTLEATIRVPEKALISTAQSLHPTTLKQAFRLLRYTIFLSTNELLPLSQTDKVLQWALRGGHFWVIESVLKQRTPTTDIFAKKEDALAVQLLLEHGANVKSWVDGRLSALNECTMNLRAGKDCTEIIRLLIENGADVNEVVGRFYGDMVNDAETKLLHDVIESGNTEVARLFLNAGAYVDIQGAPSPLQLSALHGHTELVKLLLEFNADVNAHICGNERNITPTEFMTHTEQHHFLTPLQIAIANDNYNVVEILLEHGADVNGFDAQVSGDEDEYNMGLRYLYYDNIWSPTCDEHNIFDLGSDDDDYLKISACITVSRINLRDLRLASSPLQAAAASGNTALVHRLLTMGADIHAVGGFGTALQVASAKKGNIQIVELLLSHGAHINAPAFLPIGRTALQAAIEIGDMDIVVMLLNAGADINAEAGGKYGCTALQAAVETNNVPLAAWLFQLQGNNHKKKIRIPQKFKHIKNTSMFDLLLQNCDLNGEIMIRYAERIACRAADGQNTRDLRTLLERGFDVDYLGDFLGESDLLCCWAGADVNSTVSGSSIQGPTAMEMAAATGSVKLCQILLKANADLRGNRGTVALVAAAQSASIQVIELLLSLGASPNWEDESGPKECIFHSLPSPIGVILSAMENRWPDLVWYAPRVIKLLLNHGAAAQRKITNLEHLGQLRAVLLQRLFQHGLGADSHTELIRSIFLLKVSARQGNMDIVQQLVTENTDIICSSKAMGVALQRAVEGQHQDIVELLISNGADINYPAEDVRGATALQWAALVGSMPIFTLLLDRGADVNAAAARIEGREALEAAAEHGRLGMVYMLLVRDREPETLGLRREAAAKRAESRGFFACARALREWGGPKAPEEEIGVSDWQWM